MRIDSICGQRFRVVSSSETSLGTLRKLSKRKVWERSCGLHLIHRVVGFVQKSTMSFFTFGWLFFIQNISQLVCCSHVFSKVRRLIDGVRSVVFRISIFLNFLIFYFLFFFCNFLSFFPFVFFITILFNFDFFNILRILSTQRYRASRSNATLHSQEFSSL